MQFEPTEMITHGNYDNFHFERVKGRFNGWNIAIVSSLGKGLNVTNLRNETAEKFISDMTNDFVNLRKILENNSDEEVKIAVETPDGLVIEGDMRKIDAVLKRNYNRGLWDKQER